MELLVAMTVTTLIVASLISITSIAMDTWNRSRSELRASRQAKSMVDSMARDLESFISRRDNSSSEWLSATAESVTNSPGEVPSAVKLIFFTAAADRYLGAIGSSTDMGGDVSCVGYQLGWQNPTQTGTSGNVNTFVLNRHLVNPDVTFSSLLGKNELASSFSMVTDPESFVCENVFQFSVTFNVQVPTTTAGVFENRQITIGPATGNVFRVTGKGLTEKPTDDPDPKVDLTHGKITSMAVSITVLSDAGVEQLRKSSGKANDPEFLAKNSYQYSKLVQLPGF
jgi:hypothetical protein